MKEQFPWPWPSSGQLSSYVCCRKTSPSCRKATPHPRSSVQWKNNSCNLDHLESYASPHVNFQKPLGLTHWPHPRSTTSFCDQDHPGYHPRPLQKATWPCQKDPLPPEPPPTSASKVHPSKLLKQRDNSCDLVHPEVMLPPMLASESH